MRAGSRSGLLLTYPTTSGATCITSGVGFLTSGILFGISGSGFFSFFTLLFPANRTGVVQF
jgi:hypothetical protein